MEPSSYKQLTMGIAMPLLFFISLHMAHAQTTTTIEAEGNHTVVTDADNDIGNVGWTEGTTDVDGISIFDNGDKISIAFNVATAGDHIIRARVRSGYSGNATGYWPNGYVFALDNQANTITLTGDATTTVFTSNLGQAYFGVMESGTIALTAGTHTLYIEASSTWAIVDQISIEGPIGGGSNQSPVADAGADQTVTLPTSSVMLDGVGSSDSDGSITGYSWAKTAGGVATFSATDVVDPTVSGLVAGSYTFELTVTDNDGATATDEVNVTVNPASGGGGSGNRVDNGLLALYTFQEGSGNTVNDVSGVGSPLDLTIGTPGNTSWISGGGLDITGESVLSTADSATKIISGAQLTDALTVEVWVKPANTTQSGPARLAGASLDGSNRNFTLAQDGARYTMRRRTTGTDNNGLAGIFSPAQSLTTTLTHVVYTHEGGTERIYLDGSNVATQAKASDYSNWDAGYRFLVAGEDNTVGSRFWLGEIYLVAVYDRALTGAEVTQNYNEGHQIGGGGSGGNQLPVADAGADQTITLPTDSLTLDGSGSSDNDGSITGYSWVKTAGGAATFSATDVVDPTVSGLVAGSYTFELTVTDNAGDTAIDVVNVTVNAAPTGQPPTANAGADISITLPTSSTPLSGSGTDPENGTLTYGWSQVGTLPNVASFNDTTLASPTVSGLIEGSYTFRLRVTDEQGLEALDTVAVTVDPAAGGSGNRVDNGLLALYTFQEGSGNTVNDVSGVGSPLDLTIGTPGNTSWISGGGLDITGESVLSTADSATKIISGAQLTDALTVEVWVKPANTTQSGPARLAGASLDGSNRNFTLAQDGARYTMRRRTTGTDNNGLAGIFSPAQSLTTTLTHVVYTHEGGTERIYLDGSNVATQAKASDYSNWDAGYRFLVAGEDNTVGSRFWLGEIYLVAVYDRALTGAEVTQNYNEGHQIGGGGSGGNQLPVADAGADQTITLPTDSLTLDGSGSSDNDGSITGYSWVKTAGGAATFSATDVVDPTVSGLVAGSYTFELTVTDNAGDTAIDVVNVTVNAAPTGQPPTANAGADISITLPTSSTPLSGSGTDPENGTLTYGWSQVGTLPNVASFNDTTLASPTVSGLIEGSYTFRLRVTDEQGLEALDTVAVTVDPAAGGSGNRVDNGLLALYTFQEGSGNTVNDVSGVGSPLDLTIGTPGNTSWISGGGLDITGESVLSTADSATKIISGAQLTDALTVEVWVKPANTTQSGPARLAGASLDGSNRNFTLAQDGARYTMRRRTTGTDNNGLAGIFSPAQSLTTTLTHVVYTHEGGTERIYLDGSNVATQAKASDYSNWDAGYRFLVAGEDNTVGSRFWLGEIYLVAVYDRALTGAEVTQNYNEGHDIDNAQGGNNQPPTADAGNGGTIILPTTSITLNGSGTDPENGTLSYSWEQVGNTPRVAVLTNDTTANLTIDGLTLTGTYTFRLTVTDDGGATANDEVTVTVNAASGGDTQPPTFMLGTVVTAVYDTTDVTYELNWLPATDNVAMGGYRILLDGTLIADQNSNNYLYDQGLTASTTYFFEVVAYDAAGNVSDTLSTTVTTPADISTGSTYYAQSGGEWDNVTWSSDAAGNEVLASVPGEGDAVHIYGVTVTISTADRVSGDIFLKDAANVPGILQVNGRKLTVNGEVRITRDGRDGSKLTADATGQVEVR